MQTPKFPDYCTESSRRSSFVNWRGEPSSSRLAEAGFFNKGEPVPRICLSKRKLSWIELQCYACSIASSDAMSQSAACRVQRIELCNSTLGPRLSHFLAAFPMKCSFLISLHSICEKVADRTQGSVRAIVDEDGSVSDDDCCWRWRCDVYVYVIIY